MKRCYTILSALLLLAVSCVQEGQISTPSASETEPTVSVILSFAEPVTLQADTRADFGTEMEVTPAITSLHVAVFGSSGYLKDYVSAVPCDATGNIPGEYADENTPLTDNSPVYYFKVRLPVNLEPSERRLHIIANGPSSLPFNAYEPDVMKSMTVGSGVGAYWQRIVLPQGIYALEDDSAEEGYTINTNLSALQDIRLIRNFASVVVSETAKNFKLVSYMLCNMPESGSVAAYCDEYGDWLGYEDLMPDSENAPVNFMGDGFITYGTGGEKRYPGFPLNPELDTFVPTSEGEYEASGMAVDTYGDAGDNPDPYKSIGYPIYIYERAVTHDTPPFILMKGLFVDKDTQDEDLEEKFSDADYTYYRLDIARDYLEYFPLYRNYRYEVRISGVEVPGYDTPGEAAQHNSGDNFSMSLETELLSDVANDKLHLFVQEPFIDLTYDSEIHEFWYRLLVRDLTNGTQSADNTKVEISLVPGGDALAEIVDGDISGFTPAAETYWYREAADRDAKDDQDTDVQERFVKFKLNNPVTTGATKLSSTLRLVATVKENEHTATEKTYRLVREVTIRVYNPETEALRLVPDWVANEAGQETRLELPLPLDLERSMFPLKITISDSDKALNPTKDEQMPVSTSNHSYGFDYILNWSNYQQLCQEAEYTGADHALLTCDLKMIKAISNVGTVQSPDYSTTVTAKCTFFSGSAVLHADPDNYLKPSWKTVKPSDFNAGDPITATVSVKSGSAWSLTITLEDGSAAAGASLSKSYNSSASTDDVTVTLPAFGDYNVLYRLTLANADQQTRTAYILQQTNTITISLIGDYAGASPKHVPCGTANSTETYSKIVSVESGVPYYLQVSEDGGVTYQDASSRLEPDDPVKLRIPGNSSTNSRVLYIRARSAEVDEHGDPVLYSTNPPYVTVTQDGANAHLKAPLTIRNYESDAGVTVKSSMAVVLRAFDANNDLSNPDELNVAVYDEDGNRVQVTSGNVTTDAITPLSLKANSNGKLYKLRFGVNNTSADRVFKARLYADPSGTLEVDRTIIQTASFSLSPANTDIACNATSATLTFKTEVHGDITVSGGNTYGTVSSGVAISPDYADFDTSHPETLEHTLTLTVPENNTIAERIYTVTATNNTYTWKEIVNDAIVATTGRSKTATVTQAAGTAELSVEELDMVPSDNDVDIRMNDTGVDVKVTSSFPTMVRVYCGNTLLTASGSETLFAADPTDGVEHTVPVPANNTGSPRTLTMRLCNREGVEFPTLDQTVTQAGAPVFTLTAVDSNIACDDTDADLTFTTEVNGNFTISGTNSYGNVSSSLMSLTGPDLSGMSVPATSYSTHALTLHVPANNTIEARTFTVTASGTYNGDRSVTSAATVTQAAGTAALTVTEPDIDSGHAGVDIRMNDTDVNVTVASSFRTLVKVYEGNPVTSGATPLTTSSAINANTSGEVVTVTVPANTSGSDRVLTLRLCNADGVEFPSLDQTVTQSGTPAFSLTSNGAHSVTIGPDIQSVTLTFETEVTGRFSVTGGNTFGSITSSDANYNSAYAADVNLNGGTYLSGMDFTPDGYDNYTLTLTVPKNNTVNDRTYTVQVSNASYPGVSPQTVTITQTAGDAQLTVVDTNIMMCQPTAKVNAGASFNYVLKVYDNSSYTGTPVYVSGTNNNTTVAEKTLGDTTNNLITSGNSRILYVALCNEYGMVVRTGTINQEPGIRLTVDKTSVKGNVQYVTLTVVSDVDWKLTSTNGGTFGPANNAVAPYTAVATDYSGVQVRLNMPVNYTTSDKVYAVTVAEDTASPSLSANVSVTQLGGRLTTGNTAEFTISDYRSAYSSFNRSNPAYNAYVEKDNCIKGTFDALYRYDSPRIDITYLNGDDTAYLDIEITNQVVKITKVVFDFYHNIQSYAPTQIGTNPANVGTFGSLEASLGHRKLPWTGEVTDTIRFIFRNTDENIAIRGYTVTYDKIVWD